MGLKVGLSPQSDEECKLIAALTDPSRLSEGRSDGQVPSVGKGFGEMQCQRPGGQSSCIQNARADDS